MTPQGALNDPLKSREDARDYLMEMIDQLAKLARRNGEVEIAIHLKAIVDAEGVAERKRSA